MNAETYLRTLPLLDASSLPAVDRTCSICQDRYCRPGRRTRSQENTTTEPGLRLPCGHHFCGECLRAWFTQSNRCPLCRTTLFGDERGGAGVSEDEFEDEDDENELGDDEAGDETEDDEEHSAEMDRIPPRQMWSFDDIMASAARYALSRPRPRRGVEDNAEIPGEHGNNGADPSDWSAFVPRPSPPPPQARMPDFSIEEARRVQEEEREPDNEVRDLAAMAGLPAHRLSRSPPRSRSPPPWPPLVHPDIGSIDTLPLFPPSTEAGEQEGASYARGEQ
ncbi:MAG: hypothetical protein Q9191_002627 [Dirinaria sp. TL-2023a]